MNNVEKFSAAQEAYAGKIRTFARNSFHQLPGFTQEDLEQELSIVLWKCVDNYNPDKGASFNTFFQGSAKNRIISLVRFYNTQQRKADVTSLDEEAVATAINAALATGSAETTALMRMDIREQVSIHGEAVLSRRGRKVRAA